MKYETYFSVGQEVLLRRFSAGAGGIRVEEFHAVLAGRDGRRFDLDLVGGMAQTSFHPGEFLELQSDRYACGLRLNGMSLSAPAGRVQFEALDDLELFFRRKDPRVSTFLWIGCLRQEEQPRPLREAWESVLNQLDQGAAEPELAVAILRQRINLSDGGLRLELPAPVRNGEPLLCYLLLDDRQPTICALAEVLWHRPAATPGRLECGARFAGLLDQDRQRLERYVAGLLQHRGNSADLDDGTAGA